MNAVEVLEDRRLSGWQLGDDDGYRLYAAVDGGGMASVTSLGSLHELNERGYLDLFDGIAGSSGGSLNAAYAMTGQALEGAYVYTDYLPDNGFMRMGHPTIAMDRNSPDSGFINIPFLPFVDMSVLHGAMTGVAALKLDMLVNDPRELAIGASDLTIGSPALFTNHGFQNNPEGIIDVLLAGASMSLGVTGSYPKIGDDFHSFADAALFWPTTDTIARRQAPTHVLNIGTGPRVTKTGSLPQWAVDRFQAAFAGRYSVDGHNQVIETARERDRIIGRFITRDTVMIEGVVVTRIYPEGTELPNRQTKEKDLLVKGFEAGIKSVATVLERVAA